MKAIVQNGYGKTGVLALGEVDRPRAGEKEVLIQSHAVSVNAGDAFSMKGSPWLARVSVGFPRPKNFIPGWDVAGRVEAVRAIGADHVIDKTYPLERAADAVEYVARAHARGKVVISLMEES